MLWNMFVYLGYVGCRKARKFELVLTHDIDWMSCHLNPCMEFARDIIKKKNFELAFSRIPFFFRNYVDTYDFLMTESEKVDLKSHFYFMAADPKSSIYNTPFYLNTKRFRRLINEIRSRDHIIGFHPGYTTYSNEENWISEKRKLENILGIEVLEGRQHYLRMEVVKTLSIWEKQGMRVDSTLGYADRDGFRCGTGDCFTLFDFLNRKKMRLKESPLIVMDGTLKTYQTISLTDVSKKLNYYMEVGKRYGMPITFLFHNSSFDIWDWKGWKNVYKECLKNYSELH